MIPTFSMAENSVFGNSQLVRVQAAGFGKNRRARVSEKLVEDRMTRWRGGETIRGEDIRKL